MHKVELTAKLFNMKGQEIREDGTDVPATLRYVAISGLIAPCRAPGEEKFWRAAMAHRLKSAGDVVELNDEEIAKIKRIIGEAFDAPEVVHAAWELLVPITPTPQPPKLAAKKGGKQ